MKLGHARVAVTWLAMGCSGHHAIGVGGDAPPIGDVALAGSDAGEAVDAPTPKLVCDVRAAGAIGDGSADDTVAIQRAADACASGGQLLFSADPDQTRSHNTFLTGTFTIHQDPACQVDCAIEMRVEVGATVLGVIPVLATELPPEFSDPPDYPYPLYDLGGPDPYLQNRALVEVVGVTAGFTLDGGGAIDGQGSAAVWKRSAHGGEKVGEHLRPYAVWVLDSNTVAVTDIHINDSAVWGLVLQQDDGVAVHDMHIDSWGNENQDGIDIYDSSNVAITNVDIISGDDGICFKSSDPRGIDSASVTSSTITGMSTTGDQTSGGNGLKFGATASHGPFTHVTFANDQVSSYSKAALELDSVGGSEIAHVTFQNITYDRVGAPIYVVLGYAPDVTAAGVSGSIDDVMFDTIGPAPGSTQPVGSGYGSTITGSCVYQSTYDDSDPKHPVVISETLAATLELGHITLKDVDLGYVGSASHYAAGSGDPLGEPPEFTRDLFGGYPDPDKWKALPAHLLVRHAANLTLGGTTFSHAGSADARPDVLRIDTGTCTADLGCPANQQASQCPASRRGPATQPATR